MNLTILYGSETGTAQDIAEEIWKTARRKGIQATVSSLDDYRAENLVLEKLIVFVVATAGQGDPPSNMKQFWKRLLRKSLPRDFLADLEYGILGLGDSSYKYYNFAGKKLGKRLVQLGARELLPIGLADDQHDLGIDAAVDEWIDNLWKRVLCRLNFIEFDSTDDEIYERYNVTLLEDDDNASLKSRNIYSQESLWKVGRIIENKRTTSRDHFQDVRSIKIECDDIKYQPGDIINVRPKNSVERVDEFFNIFTELNPNSLIRISEKEIKLPKVLEQDLKLKDIVEQYWDLNYKPRRSTMKILSCISENQLERDKLIEFTTPQGVEEFYNYVTRPRRNILEVLQDFPYTTGRLNINLLFEIMGVIKPRAFSIASSMKTSTKEIDILVAVVKYKTKLIEPRLGLCSNWLASLRINDDLSFSIESGTLKFAYDKKMILIAPGTGIAPFRSLLLDKAASNKNLNDCILFFGCRYKDKDYHYQNDLQSLSDDFGLKLFLAFSRDQNHKVYVQDIIEEEKQLCWDYIENGAHIYVAGNSKNMPNSVRDEFISMSKEFGKIDDNEAQDFILRLEKCNRYQIETWS